jgi:agmatine deiminase
MPGHNDELTNTVFFAEALKRYPQVLNPAKINLEANGVKVEFVKGTKNIWARDYMPLQVNDHFVKFRYKTVAYDDYPILHVDDSCWDFLPNVIKSDIVLDGGNCQRYGNRAIITDIVFEHNLKIPRKELKDDLVKKLSDLLEAEIIIIPAEPGDDLGHADGIVKWINPYFALINDYSVMKSREQNDYQKNLTDILQSFGIRVIPMTYAYDKCPQPSEEEFRAKYPDADDLNPGAGYYINSLLVRDVVLLPLMNWPEDVKAMSNMKTFFPKKNVVGIDCFDLSMEGGLTNCVSMNYRL